MESISAKVIDNHAGVIGGGREGSVRDIFEHLATHSGSGNHE